jgi:hypothetical protein
MAGNPLHFFFHFRAGRLREGPSLPFCEPSPMPLAREKALDVEGCDWS